MDPIEKQAELSPEIFWHRGKKDLLRVLLSDVAAVFAEPKKEKKILLVGPGYSDDQLELIHTYGRIDVIDKNNEVIDAIDGKFVSKKICNDFLQHSFDEGYDLIILLDVIEHIGDEELCFKKLRKVVKKDGHVILTVPAYQFLFCNYDTQVGHYRRYTASMLKKNRYFSVVRIGYWNSLLLPLFVCERLYERVCNKEHTFKQLPTSLNKIFYGIISFENFLISKNINPPFGLSVYAILKPNK